MDNVPTMEGKTRANAASILMHPHRLQALRVTGLLDVSPNVVLDRLARLVTRLLRVPVATVTLIDENGQHFPGMAGLAGPPANDRGTPLSYSLCKQVLDANAPFVVSDTALNPLTRHHPARLELGIAAYMGVPLRSADGLTLGALCAIDTKPVDWTAEQMEILEDLACAAAAEIDLRSAACALLAAQERLSEQAVRDPLTGLLNRRGFGERARQHMTLASRTGHSFLLCAFDLNGFKAINDRFGHDVGDSALVDMASVLTGTFRECDVVCRAGGDEFLVLATGTGATDGALVTARVEAALAARNASMPHELPLSSGIGIATWHPETPVTVAELLRRADEAMYVHKRFTKAQQKAIASVAA